MLDTTVEIATVADAVRLACRAPSLHNSQPWLWAADGDRLDLFLDQTRTVHGDRWAREALISCGAALDHVQVAMAAAGWAADVQRFPDPGDPQHLATIRFHTFRTTGYPAETQSSRADAILARRTDRLPFLAPQHWEPIEALLRADTVGGSVRLDVLAAELRPRLAKTAQLTEALRLYDSSYHVELDWWTAPFEVTDGIPQSALVSAAESDRVDVGRNFPVTSNRERRSGIGDDRATLLMLFSDSDDPADALACGEMLSAVLLDCTLAGLATCPLTHLTELDTSREMLAALTGHDDLPQVLIRVGSVPMTEEVPEPTPRRPLRDVLRVKD